MDTKKVSAVGTIEDVSEEQMNVVRRLREVLKERLEAFPDLKTTWSLLRFCRARDFNFEKIKLMLEGFMDFRAEVDYKRVAQLEMSEFKTLTDNYARGYVGYDQEGRVVLLERVALSNVKTIVGNVSKDQIRDYFVNIYERLIHVIFPTLSRIHNKRIDRTVLVIDLEGVNLLKLFDSNLQAFLKFSSKMAQDYYPELLGKSFIVNAPWVFQGVWSIVKIWLDKKTTEKFVFASNNGKDQLAKCMDIRILPRSLGGENDQRITDFTGPWEKDLIDSWEKKSFYLKDRTPEYEYFYTEAERKDVISRNERTSDSQHFGSSLSRRMINFSELDTNNDDSVLQQPKVSSFRVQKLSVSVRNPISRANN